MHEDTQSYITACIMNKCEYVHVYCMAPMIDNNIYYITNDTKNIVIFPVHCLAGHILCRHVQMDNTVI